MSKLVSIVEGQSSKQFNNVGFLRTSLQGGGYCDWIPEDERVLKSKSVTKNGTYKAINDSAYAYDEFTVNVPKKDSVTGKKPNGNEATVSRDNEGNLVETGVPSSIRITTNPSKMTYSDGETIDMSGAVIKAYNTDGGLWGNVPLNEVSVSPSTADGGGALPGLAYYEFPEETYVYKYPGYYNDYYFYAQTFNGARIVFIQYGEHVYYYTFCNNNQGYSKIGIAEERWGQPTAINWSTPLMRNIGNNYYGGWGRGDSNGSPLPFIYSTLGNIPYGGENPPSTELEELQAALPYAYRTVTVDQTINVSWKRPGDNKKLTTSFNITVS